MGIMMPTVHREEGYAIRIYTDDHPPPHVHVRKGSGGAKIQLDDGAGEPMVIWHEGLKESEKVRAFRLVVRHREKLLTEWRKIHGD